MKPVALGQNWADNQMIVEDVTRHYSPVHFSTYTEMLSSFVAAPHPTFRVYSSWCLYFPLQHPFPVQKTALC